MGWTAITARWAVAALLVFVGAAAAQVGPVRECRAEEDAAGEFDRVLLKNGRTFEGRIVSEDRCAVVLELVSESGGSGRMHFPLAMVRRIERGRGRAMPSRPGCVRDAWYLLKSGDQILGARHLTLRHLRQGRCAGWRLESTVEHFARGPQVPALRIQLSEHCDLAFRPTRFLFREVGEASSEPGGPRRYERILSGPVSGGVWNALIHVGGAAEQRLFPLPTNARGRLGTREHLLRTRKPGIASVTFFDAERAERVTARAGYTALDAVDASGRPYDEFVWEEDGVRLVSRFRDCEVLEEAVAEDVVAVPATEDQVDAARAERGGADDEPGLVRLASAGLSLRVPGPTWTFSRVEVPPATTGWRKVAVLASRPLVADVRVEWDPEGAALAPGQREAVARLTQRLRAWCPDLRVVRSPVPIEVPRAGGEPSGEPAWRVAYTGTLKGERVRTVAVVLDRGQGRILVLAACPEVSWPQAAHAINRLVASLERL